MSPSNVLRAFAELARQGSNQSRSVRPATDMEPLRYRTRRVFDGKSTAAKGLVAPSAPGGHLSSRMDRMIGAAMLHKAEQLLRVGWVWFSGTVEIDGEAERFCVPVLSMPVSVRSLDDAATASQMASSVLGGVLSGFVGGGSTQVMLDPNGDAEISEHIEEDIRRAELLESVFFGPEMLKDNHDDLGLDYFGPASDSLEQLPELVAWCRRAAVAMGLEISEWRLAQHGHPVTRSKEPGIAAHVMFGLYLDDPPAMGTRRGSLLNLALTKQLPASAFARIYSDGAVERGDRGSVLPVRPLSQAQSRVAAAAGEADVAVISGAPGTGKTHVLSVIALNAIARGESVLVVAGSSYAVDVLIDHFSATPGPTPVAFGGSVHGQRLAEELSELLSRQREPGIEVDHVERYLERRAAIERALRVESEATRLDRDPLRRIDAVAAIDRAGDLDDLRRRVQKVQKPAGFLWLQRRRVGKLQARLGNLVDSRDDPEFGYRAAAALLSVELSRDALRLLAAGGLRLDDALTELVALEADAAKDHGRRVTRQWLGWLGNRERRTLAQVASAVASSRAARHRALAEIKQEHLVRAAPLWVGSVRDVEDVLPAVAGMFDLVILDEASQINQLHAASALVRAKRAVICGDPQQLGLVSFLSGAQLDDVGEQFDLDMTGLNPRSMSVFDMGASQVPVDVLDEHFRSAPHLIEFSARRLYGGSLHSATRHPENESADHIHLEVVDGARDANKVNHAEVERCLQVADRYIADGWDSIGFLSPFRAQADALQEAVLDRFRFEEIERYGLRVGTVHGFQGDERRVVIASWAVGRDEPETAWRWLNQRGLFNVMATRARDEFVIVTSNPEPPGLAGEYVEWSEPLEGMVREVPVDDPWVHKVARGFVEQGLGVRTGYPVGRHVVDLVVGEGSAAMAVDCSPHSDGPEAHIDRALMLRRAGWKTTDAFESRWKDQIGQLAIELIGEHPDLSPQP